MALQCQTKLQLACNETMYYGFYSARLKYSHLQSCCCPLQVHKHGPFQAGGALALWWFIHPHVAARFADFVKGLKEFSPQPDQFPDMLDWGTAHPIDERSSVFYIHQGPGTIISVPPGWVHCVINLLACCKVAWDFFDMKHLASYAALRRDICSPLFRGEGIADDYMAVAPVISKAVCAPIASKII